MRCMRAWSWTAVVVSLVALCGVAAAGGGRAVPDVVGLPQAAAQAELAAAGFRAVVAPATGEPAGVVARQEPGGFWFSDPSVPVTIYVRGAGAAPSVPTAPSVPVPPGSTPPSPPTPSSQAALVPTVVGKTEAEAITALRAWRVAVDPVQTAPGDVGRVVDQDPPPGTALAAGEQVRIAVGRADAPSSDARAIPNVVGLSLDAALQTLQSSQLVPLVNRVPSDAAGDGKVLSQEPAAGAVVARGSNIVVNVGRAGGSGLLELDVPDVRRLSEAEARARLRTAGLAIVVEDRLADASSANLVVDQSPPPGTRAARETPVTIVVGRLLLLPVAVPDVMGREAPEAERALRDAGFVVERATALSLPGSAGRVVAQEPAGGQSAIRGSVVRVTVGQSSATSMTNVPAVAGLGEAAATQRLQAMGFTVVRQAIPGASTESGLVRGTQPATGTPLPRGAEVRLLVVEAAAVPAAPGLPSYVGTDAAAAQADLQARGYAVTISPVVGVPPGRVMGQMPAAGTPLARGSTVTLTVARAPSLAQVTLVSPPSGTSLPKNYGVLFVWNPVPGADDYQFEIFKWKDDTWVVADNDIERKTEKRPSRVKSGVYQWHVRARRANGSILGDWSEWRRLTIY